MLEFIVPALQNLLTIENLIWINLGVFIGSVFAAIPGLTVILCIILFLPFTYQMTAIPGMMFLLGIYCAGGYGGSVSAILINTPGTPHAAATMLDGYPLNQQIEARKNMVKRGVAQEAWAPFGEGMQNMFSNPTLAKIGEVHGKSVAQVILRWLTQRDIVALPKSTHKERMEENLNIFDFRLSDSEMTTIAGLDTKTSMFFRHDTPEAVDRFVGYVKERAGRE